MHPSKKRWNSPYGYTNPTKDAREMCIYCKNEDTVIVIDKLDLAPYVEHYKGIPFKLVECPACGAKFHYRVDN